MNQSSHSGVKGFLEDLSLLDPAKYAIVQACRKLVLDINPNVAERFIYGGIMFSLNGVDFGGLFASKNHVSFEFGQGNELDDPSKILEGVGKFRRHIKLKKTDDVEGKRVIFFIQQLELNN